MPSTGQLLVVVEVDVDVEVDGRTCHNCAVEEAKEDDEPVVVAMDGLLASLLLFVAGVTAQRSLEDKVALCGAAAVERSIKGGVPGSLNCIPLNGFSNEVTAEIGLGVELVVLDMM